MPEIASAMILGFTILAVKHTVADYFLQSPYQYMNKGIYGHPGGVLHSGIHAALTAPVFLVLPAATLFFGILILLGEFAVHYHVDWLKERMVRGNGWGPDTANFWHALGLDQLAHLLTYIAIIALLVR